MLSAVHESWHTAAIIISTGAGPYSLDALILSLMNKHVA
jgi:hypothetical protein